MMAPRRDDLWTRLLAADIVTGAIPATDDAERRIPWYVRALVGIAGWIAAGFMLAFIGSAFRFVMRSNTSSFVTGLLMIVGAYALFRMTRRHAFTSQFAVAISLAGQVLVWMGVEPELRDSHLEWLAVIAFHAAAALLLPHFVLRVWNAGAAAMASAFLLLTSGAYFLSIGLLSAATAAVWLHEFTWPRAHSLVRAIGYGFTLALVLIQSTVFFAPSHLHALVGDEIVSWVPQWVGWLLPGLVLMAVVWRLHARHGATLGDRNTIVAIAGAAAVTAASFKAPGIATGLTLALLGYSNANKSLVGLGLVALLSYLSAYYYLLESTLLMKSVILAVTGSVLLVVRFAMMHQLFPSPELRRA